MPHYSRMFSRGEVILIHYRDNPSFFARVENVKADRKKGWWQISFLILIIPPKKMTWILDDDQMRGGDFTMGGNPIRIERVEPELRDDFYPEEEFLVDGDQIEEDEESSGARIVSLFGDDE
jgi:hypothetical protein